MVVLVFDGVVVGLCCCVVVRVCCCIIMLIVMRDYVGELIRCRVVVVLATSHVHNNMLA